MRVGRILAVLVGLVLTAVGLLTLLSMGTGLVLVGFDDTLETGRTRFASPTAAIASDLGDLGDDSAGDRVWGEGDHADLRIAASADREVFVGVGPTDQVRDYLDQAPWDEADVLSAGRFSTSSDDVDYDRQGSGEPRALPAPGDETFWTVSRSGLRVDLRWDFRRDDQTIVLMNADGQPDVATRGSFELDVPRLSLGLGIGVAIGAVLLVAGLLFLFRVARRRKLELT